MGRLKPSIFNEYTTNENKELILYNSYNDNMNIAKFTKENSAEVEKILSQKECEGDSLTQKWLFKHGFLVSIEEDETYKLQLKYIQYIADKKLHLYILPTFSCNLRCSYCYENHINQQMSEEIQEAIIKYVKKNISKYIGLHVSWFGGEPLLATNTIVAMSRKFIKICQACNRTYDADMSTNGYLLNKDTFELLLSLRVRFYQITLDGLREVHDKLKTTLKGEGTFDIILENLLNAQKVRKKYTIVIRSNFVKENINKIEGYVNFYYSLFNNDKRFYFAPGAAGNWGNAGENCDASIFLDNREKGNIFEELLHCEHVLNYGFFSNFSKYGRTICYASKLNSFAIGPNGLLYKCTCNFDMDENRIGHITKDGDFYLDEAKYSVWVTGAMKYLSVTCNNCFYSGKCCGSYCIANSMIRSKTNDFCCFPPFSKSYFKQQILLYDKFTDIKPVLIKERDGK